MIQFLPRARVVIRMQFRQDGMAAPRLSEKHYLSKAVLWSGNIRAEKKLTVEAVGGGQ